MDEAVVTKPPVLVREVRRHVMQMQVVHEGSYEHWYALCEDGTMWKMRHDLIDGGAPRWLQINGPPPKLVRGHD